MPLAYRAVRSILWMYIALRAPSQICGRSGLEYVKVRSPQLLAAACSEAQPAPAAQAAAGAAGRCNAAQPAPAAASCLPFENCSKVVIFFPTMTPIDIRPSTELAHDSMRRHAKFRRRASRRFRGDR